MEGESGLEEIILTFSVSHKIGGELNPLSLEYAGRCWAEAGESESEGLPNVIGFLACFGGKGFLGGVDGFELKEFFRR